MGSDPPGFCLYLLYMYPQTPFPSVCWRLPLPAQVLSTRAAQPYGRSPVRPSSTASEASSAQQTRPLALRRQCCVARPCFSAHPRATNAPPSPRRSHNSGREGATAPDARHVTIRVRRLSGPSAPLLTRT